MTPEQLQSGADWLYAQFYRMDRIILRTIRGLFALGPLSAWLIWQLNRNYRYDNRRENISGCNPATTTRSVVSPAPASPAIAA